MATWHKYLSDYEFCLWNEETCATYVAAHNLPNPMEHPFVKGAYAAKKYAFVADYVRFWALYHCGGVYLDTDMYVIRNMDDMLDADFREGAKKIDVPFRYFYTENGMYPASTARWLRRNVKGNYKGIDLFPNNHFTMMLETEKIVSQVRALLK